MTIGSHTHDHLLFDRIPPADARNQIQRSVGLIHDRLGLEDRLRDGLNRVRYRWATR